MPAVLAPAQTQPLSVGGVFSSGYYNTWTHGDTNQSINFVPAGARFDISGYYLTPDLITFTVQPQLNYGPQASEAGFEGGNGISIRATMLRRRFPLTFRYSNVQVDDVYFGSLSQISAYRLGTRTRDLGLTWDVKAKKLPSLTLDMATGSVDSNSGNQAIPPYSSSTEHINADSRYETKGWDINGFAHLQRQLSNVFAIQPDGTTGISPLRQDLFQSQMSARRVLWEDSEIYFDGGRQSISDLLLGTPLNLTTNYATANLRLFERKRVKTSLHAGYSSNIAGELLNRIVSGLNGTGPGAVLTESTVLTPFERTISNLNLTSSTEYQVASGLSLYGRLDRSLVFAPATDGAVNASFFTISGGATYTHKFAWGTLGGQYGREMGMGSVTGQSGTISGENYLVSFQHGTSGGRSFDGSIHGAIESIHNAQPAANRSFSADVSVSQPVAVDWNVRIGGGWQRGSFQSGALQTGASQTGASQFLTNGYTGRLGVEHRRVQFSAALNTNLGTSLPEYGLVYSNIAVGAALLSGLVPVPSDLRAWSVTFHATPFRKLELMALWTHSLQHLDGLVNNDFQIIDIKVTYRFRRLQIDAGYTKSNQIFTTFVTYPESIRGRIYIRISRTAKLL
ncbi:MAG: hypothetical protein KGN84_19235 [Acidobacteriota bacterium]|nr:hypothetical protein [Acidobacteriota bacterium]